MLKRMGLKPGMSDFLFVSPTGQHHWLELKRGRAPLTEAQQAFAQQLRACGTAHHVARSYEDAVNQLKAWPCWNARRIETAPAGRR